MTKHFAIRLLAGLLSIPASVQCQGVEGRFTDMARFRDGFRSKRISSCDRTGGNNGRFETIPGGGEGLRSKVDSVRMELQRLKAGG